MVEAFSQTPTPHLRDGGSARKLRRLPGFTLPVLGDLAPEVEVDRGAEERLDLLAGDGPDLAQTRPLVADHDALLRGPLDVQAGADVEQRLVLGPVLAQPHLVDDHGDRVRELVAYAVE